MAHFFSPLLLALGLALGTAPSEADPPGKVEALLQNAATYLGQAKHLRSIRGKNGRTYRGDCSGYIHAIYDSFGVAIGDGPTRSIYAWMSAHQALHRDRPAPGDLVFFHDTYDRNGDGRIGNDGLTHVGIVETVFPNGDLTFLHRTTTQKGIIREKMNLTRGSRARHLSGFATPPAFRKLDTASSESND